MRYPTYLFYIICLLMASPLLYGQETEAPDKESRDLRTGGFGYFALSGQQMDIGPLNSMLKEHGYP